MAASPLSALPGRGRSWLPVLLGLLLCIPEVTRGDGSSTSPSAPCGALLAAHAASGADVGNESDEAALEVRRAVHAMGMDEAAKCAEAALDLGAGGQPAGVARLIEQVARHPECVRELATKSEAQTRCAQKWYKIAIHALTVANKMGAAEAMWHRATSLQTDSPSARIGWPSPLQTPTVWLESLESKKTWDCASWPFVSRLETYAPQILEEVQEVASRFSTAYPYLARGGTWQNLFLYRGHDWDEALCAALPFTCRLLRPELPTKPGVPFSTQFNEEVVIFRSEPGASVGAHCGSSNGVINLHFTLTGAEGTSLRIGEEDFPLTDGKAVCFQDSFFHAVEHKGSAKAERISLVVRVMHPQLSLEAYGGAPRTDVVEDLHNWDTAKEMEQEVQRLRDAYRKLVSEVAVLGGNRSVCGVAGGATCEVR